MITSLNLLRQIKKPFCRKCEKKFKQKGSEMATGEHLWAENLSAHYQVSFKEKDARVADKFGEPSIDETNVMVPVRGATEQHRVFKTQGRKEVK